MGIVEGGRITIGPLLLFAAFQTLLFFIPRLQEQFGGFEEAFALCLPTVLIGQLLHRYLPLIYWWATIPLCFVNAFYFFGLPFCLALDKCTAIEPSRLAWTFDYLGVLVGLALYLVMTKRACCQNMFLLLVAGPSAEALLVDNRLQPSSSNNNNDESRRRRRHHWPWLMLTGLIYLPFIVLFATITPQQAQVNLYPSPVTADPWTYCMIYSVYWASILYCGRYAQAVDEQLAHRSWFLRWVCKLLFSLIINYWIASGVMMGIFMGAAEPENNFSTQKNISMDKKLTKGQSKLRSAVVVV